METTTADLRPTTGTWGWLAVAVATVAISVPADVFIALVHSSSCGQPADPDSVQGGRIAMLVVLLLAVLHWLVALPLSRNGARGVAFGVVAVLPALAFVVHGYAAGAWTSSLCLGG